DRSGHSCSTLASLDAELVALGVVHPDPVLATLLDRAALVRGAEGLEPGDLGIDPHATLLDRDGMPAAGIEVDMHPVLGHLRLGNLLEEHPGTLAVRILERPRVVPM